MEMAEQYLPKEVVRKMKATEINRQQIKTSLRNPVVKSRRHATMREELKHNGMYSRHMPWLKG